MPRYEQVVYLCYSLDFDDAYIGRTKDYERRQSEHWQLKDLLPLMIILDTVTAATDDAAARSAQKLETSWRHDFDAARIPLLNKAGRSRAAPRPEEPIKGYWRMQLIGKFKQQPDTGTRVFCVEDATPHSLDGLVKVVLTHPAARRG